MPRTKEAAHQTLKFHFDIDAELQKASTQKARVMAGGGCGTGTALETYQFWHQVQLSVLYHTFQLRNEIHSLKNFAPVPASEMLVSLDKFDNALAASTDNDLDFLEDDDDDNNNDNDENTDDDDE